MDQTFPCDQCKASVRLFSTRNGGSRQYDAATGSAHRCFPERKTATADCVVYGERLVAPEGQTLKIGDSATYLEDFGRSSMVIAYYKDGVFLQKGPVDRDAFDQMKLVRTGDFVPGPPRPDPAPASGNGWLSRDGRIYPCKYWEHISLAGELEHHTLTEDLEEDGWIKLQKDNFYILGPVTQKQFDAIVEYYSLKGIEAPSFCKPGRLDVETDDVVKRNSRKGRGGR